MSLIRSSNSGRCRRPRCTVKRTAKSAAKWTVRSARETDREKKGSGVEWFVSTDGTDAGGSTIRVTKMTNYLSNSPIFTYTSLPVTAYQNATTADQPGGSVTTFLNTTTTQVQYHDGHLVTAMASSVAVDGFMYPKGLYYQIDV